MPIDRCQGPDRNPKPPAFRLPKDSCDCHAHVFGPQDRYPFAADRNYTPEDCTVADYESLLAILGVSRAVLVQGGPHGIDNRVTLDAVRQMGERCRGVAVIPSGLPQREREAMHEAGIRGVRMSTVVRGGVGFSHLENLAAECTDFGWHLLLHMHHSDELVDLAPLLRKVKTPFVLDHLARVRADEGVESKGFKTMMDLLESDRCWVKLASLYRLSSQPYPHLDMLPMIHRVVAARPDRVIWGSNWPHPVHPGVMPNDGDLVDLIPLWLPEPERQIQMLVTNPAKLYGFD